MKSQHSKSGLYQPTPIGLYGPNISAVCQWPGTAAHRSASNAPCVTISLDIKFIGASKVGDEIIGHTKILKKTNTLIFLFCELKCNNKIITSATGVWKILKVKPSNLGPGG